MCDTPISLHNKAKLEYPVNVAANSAAMKQKVISKLSVDLRNELLKQKNCDRDSGQVGGT